MGFTAALIVGLLSGALASLFRPRDDGRNIAVALAVGVVGALAALGLGRYFHWHGAQQGGEILSSSVGAMVAVTLHRLVRGRR